MLVTDYGALRVERRRPWPRIRSHTRTTRWDAGDLIVEISSRLCGDSMSGDSLESSVEVTWKGRKLRGCGRALD